MYIRYDDEEFENVDAVAIIKGSAAYPGIRGLVRFYQTDSGVYVVTSVTGLPRGEAPCKTPIFAMHIHDGDSCEGRSEKSAFPMSGMHYNPSGCEHPYHAGDLPPLFSADGVAMGSVLTNRFTVREIVGKTVIIHGGVDDFTTQPSGNSGEKIACGVIQ
ncbi:MAG: superoxide dismutase family protein [Clostridia bacterium]|nr:superoxide dismutase family protein [Clostridia bacterium]